MADTRRRVVSFLLGLVTALAGALAIMSPAGAVPPGSPIFVIFNDLNILCIQPSGASIDAGAAVVLASCRESTVQDWVRDDLGGGVVHYRNANSNLCLDAFGSAANRTQLIQWPCNTISNERWQPIHIGPDGPDDFAEKIVSRVSGTSGYCLDVPGFTESVGLQVQIYGCNGTAAQQWYEYV
jgi:hypothetical protein